MGLLMKSVLLAALVLVTAACGAYRFPGGAPPGDGTVSGTVVTLACFPVAQPVGQPAPQAITPCVGRCLPIAQAAGQAMCVSPCPPVA